MVRSYSPKTAIYAIVGLAAITTIVLTFRPKSLEWHAKNLSFCLQSRNSNCLANYCYQSELEQIGLTQAKLKKLIEVELLPQYQNFETATLLSNSNPEIGYLQFDIPITFSSGRKSSLTVQVSETENGVKASFLIFSLIYFAARDKYYQEQFPSGLTNLRVMYYKWMQDEGKRYQSEYGMTGILMNDSKGLRKFSNFEETLLNSLTAEEKAIAKIP